MSDPATGAVLGHTPRLGAAETTAAIEAAEAALPAWSARTAKDHSAVLRRWFELIIAARDDLALILTSEEGKPLEEARGKIAYAAAFVEFYAEEAKRVAGEILPSHRAEARMLVLRQPIGVVAAITPWNFPAAMITRKVGPALAASCTVVVKPASETPLTALALGVIAERAGLPAGALNIISGDPKAIGGVMTSHDAVRLVSFTGSTAVGKQLARVAALHVGDGREPGVVPGPLANAKAVDKVEWLQADAVTRGAKVVTGGKRHALAGAYFLPPLRTGVEEGMAILHEEIFGPVAPVVRFTLEADAVRMANAQRPGGLSLQSRRGAGGPRR